MGIGLRLREERERLGLNQEGFGELGGVRKQAQLLYEKDERKPDSEYLAAIAEGGVDVLYVLTGQRQSDRPAADAAESMLLDSYRRCALAGRQHIIQTAALLAAGLNASGMAGGTTQMMQNMGSGSTQIGHVGGNYNPIPKPARKRTK